MHLCRFSDAQGVARLGLVREGALYDVSERWPTLSSFLAWSSGRGDLASELANVAGATPVAQFDPQGDSGELGGLALLKPTDDQEVWAAGVTYERSRIAREEESAGSGIYERVYSAARPELFFKATPSRTVGPGEPVAIRVDASWNVPEPELGLVVN